MKTLARLLLLFGWLPAATAAETITIAAASDLKYAMDEVIQAYAAVHDGNGVEVIYGSSGRFFTQLRSGAPFDLYFSADILFPRMLADEGLTASPVHRYAIGRLVLWSRTLQGDDLELAALTRSDIRRIAIANPKHAPYGQRAEEALRATGLWPQVENRLVYGENIAQAAQFALTGNAQAGILALSLAMHPPLSDEGHYRLIPATLHAPLEQGFVVMKRAADNTLAASFAAFVQDTQGRDILARHGFSLPVAPAATDATPAATPVRP